MMVDFDLVYKVAKSLNMSDQEVMNTTYVELIEKLYDENNRLKEEYDSLIDEYSRLTDVWGKEVEGSFINASINDYCRQAHDIAKSKGWYDKPTETGTKLALIHSEVSEALEALRNGNEENFVEELADVCIRVFDLCGYGGVNLGQAIDKKMEKNRNRSYRHGGKKF